MGRQNETFKQTSRFTCYSFKFSSVYTKDSVQQNTILKITLYFSGYQRLRWSRGSVLAFGTQVRGFKTGRSRRIFQIEKILSTPSFGREVKPLVPCRRFTACKRSLNVTAISRSSSSSFHYQGLWWRHLAVQVGMTKDQGLYNKPSVAVHPGPLAAGTLPQHITHLVRKQSS